MKFSLLKKCVALFLALLPLMAFANESKVALIIGNNDYSGDFQRLPTCVNDAKEMDRCLTALGFETILVLDASREQMMTAVDKFQTVIKNNAAVGVFFYSGHAATINGEPYLIPAKTYIKKGNGRLKDYSLGINSLRSILKEQCEKSILFLDACRDVVDDDTKEFNDAAKGTGQWITPPIGKGKTNQQIICFATTLDNIARPGNSRLSPFTNVLTSHLFDKEDFETIWNDYIENEVYVLSNQVQVPVWEGTFKGNFYFNPNGVTKPSESSDNSASKKIAINVSPSTAIIRFGDKEYSSGQNLLYNIGSTYTYTIIQDGYEPYSGVLQVDQSTPSTIDVELKKIEPASIEIRCNKSAAVYFDDKFIGKTPCRVNTTSGRHSLTLTRDGYYSLSRNLILTPGKNKPYTASLTREISEYWQAPEYDGANHINYHYSPKYQIGLSYMYRPEDSRFSYGLTLASSFGWFKGMSLGLISVTSTSVSIASSNVTIDVDGVPTACKITTDTYPGDTDDKYSPEIDPYEEAKHYDANALILGNIGYHITNGIMIEAGIGAGYHQDRYHMETTYNITKTQITNLATGALVGEPTYKYIATGNSKWFKNPSKWSPAFRLGTKFFIPLDGFDQYSITIGGGYTYLPTNNKFSSWDANIGFCWYF